jgi:hypothetical protein
LVCPRHKSQHDRQYEERQNAIQLLNVRHVHQKQFDRRKDEQCNREPTQSHAMQLKTENQQHHGKDGPKHGQCQLAAPSPELHFGRPHGPRIKIPVAFKRKYEPQQYHSRDAGYSYPKSLEWL